MIIWINGAFGVGKTETAITLKSRIKNSHIYDPEQAGYFIWNNSPEELKRKGDFQDITIWRTINYDMIKYINNNYNGHLILPMTIINKDYFEEIIGRLRNDGVEVKHFILTAPKEVIIARLLGRGEKENSWAEQQVDRCLDAFSTSINGTIIDTSRATIDKVVDIILKDSGLKV